MSDLLSQTRGTLIPSSTLCCPVKETVLTNPITSDKETLCDTNTTEDYKQTLHGLSSNDEAVMRNIATIGSDTHMEVECSEEIATLPTKPSVVVQSMTDILHHPHFESKQGPITLNESSKVLLTRLNDPGTQSTTSSLKKHANGFSGSTSNQQFLGYKSQLQDNSRSKQVIFEDVLSTLVLPSSSCLNRYLQGRVAKRDTSELTPAGEESLYWLCNTGKCACMVSVSHR